MRRLQAVFYGDPNGYPPIVNTARFLAAAGWDVEIICRAARTHADVAWPRGVRVLRPAAGGHRWVEYLDFVRQARRAAKPGAVVAAHDMHGLLPAALMARATGAPLVYHCHDYAESGRRLPAGSRLVKALEPRLARGARLVVAPEARRASIMRDELALARDPLVLPNAPPIRDSRPTGRLRDALRARGMPLERIVLRQGRVGPDHAIEATLRSMPMWSAPRAGFVVMGPAAADYARQLTALAAQCGVYDRFAILPPVGYDEVPAFTADADVGHALYDPVNVNHREMGTASNKLLEYMAAGLACIVPDTPSFAALLARAAFAVPCDPASPEAIAAAVDALLAAPGMAREMGAAGERLFREELAWDRTFPALLARLEALAADCERAARSL